MSRLEALVSRVHDIVPPQLPSGSIKLSTSLFGPSLSQSTMTREGYQRAARGSILVASSPEILTRVKKLRHTHKILQSDRAILAHWVSNDVSQHGLGPGGNHRVSKFSSGSLFNRSYRAVNPNLAIRSIENFSSHSLCWNTVHLSSFHDIKVCTYYSQIGLKC
ncbi:unnamed protein product [Fraxinus pennsylvanica]|uniref:Uncharacterized protein n=1 Tax=Fraxinus pennsylvanica TaxID=56036 RepID=A0AAD2AB03_9LAMI|nr:unnamed protein product [Fraxinus pennsylvanica]